jgi:hypothetical protein
MEIATKVYLLEFKKTDYFLKLKHEETMNVSKIILNTIDSISAVYRDRYKSNKIKNNLILIQMISNKKNQNCSDIRTCM